ncbi:hypothetical protein K431DRAFT_108316 [Polychaeton citri CBS 116435]|uniref:Uncharacterized protein n=1 Tax=Polychaeton citri CBS 116435 TaxID=1314669 RepID=A0A9P4UP79_9PEZI|nr:hypothetical protein K431DRAFT_108316 [Polychaeton citri CBS 116435]
MGRAPGLVPKVHVEAGLPFDSTLPPRLCLPSPYQDQSRLLHSFPLLPPMQDALVLVFTSEQSPSRYRRPSSILSRHRRCCANGPVCPPHARTYCTCNQVDFSTSMRLPMSGASLLFGPVLPMPSVAMPCHAPPRGIEIDTSVRIDQSVGQQTAHSPSRASSHTAHRTASLVAQGAHSFLGQVVRPGPGQRNATGYVGKDLSPPLPTVRMHCKGRRR